MLVSARPRTIPVADIPCAIQGEAGGKQVGQREQHSLLLRRKMEDFCLQGCFSAHFVKTKWTPWTQNKYTYIMGLLSWIKDARSPNPHPNEQHRRGERRSEGNLKLHQEGDRGFLTTEPFNNTICQKSANITQNHKFHQSVPCPSAARISSIWLPEILHGRDATGSWLGPFECWLPCNIRPQCKERVRDDFPSYDIISPQMMIFPNPIT